MRWQIGRRSSNVEDRRRGGGGQRRGGTPVAAGGGIGIIVIALLAMFFGIDPSVILNTANPTYTDPGYRTYEQTQISPQEEQLVDFVSVVLADTEDTWNQVFREQGGSYQEPTLVLFSGSVQSACGYAQAAMGPFYCPGDRKVYIDLSFYEDLKYRHQAPGDFAQAYVIAHEVGHHVQTLLGISEQVRATQQRVGRVQANQLSVMQELQADCFAGIWAHTAQEMRNVLEPGDIEEALTAASSIGDDRLQRQSQGFVVPESFTHGSSEQRMRWFSRGLESGSLQQCDTFGARRL